MVCDIFMTCKFIRDTFSEGKFSFMTLFVPRPYVPHLRSIKQFVAEIGSGSARTCSTQMFSHISFCNYKFIVFVI